MRRRIEARRFAATRDAPLSPNLSATVQRDMEDPLREQFGAGSDACWRIDDDSFDLNEAWLPILVDLAVRDETPFDSRAIGNLDLPRNLLLGHVPTLQHGQQTSW